MPTGPRQTQQQQAHASFLASSSRDIRRRDHRRIEDTTGKSALTHRLRDALIWELKGGGESDCRRMTLRGLYNYVLESITKSKSPSPPGPSVTGGSCTSTKRPRQKSVGDTNTCATTDNRPGHREGKRLGGYIHPRDLRKIVTPLSMQTEPEVIVRRHVILMNFDYLKAIILRDRILVPVPDGDTSTLIQLERRIQRGCEDSILDDDDNGETDEVALASAGSKPIDSTSVTSSKHGMAIAGSRAEDVIKKIDTVDDMLDDFDEWAEMADRSFLDVPFELRCVDAVLTSNIQLMSQEISALTSEIYDVIENILKAENTTHQVENYRDRLRRSKNEVGEVDSLVQGFVRAIQQVLNEDEDMALMNLSHLLLRPERFIQPVSDAILEEESDEPELILEAYLQQGLTAANAMSYLKTILANTDELIDQKLDTIRNRLLYVNTIIGLLSFIVATGSLVGSFFGMNLTNYLEDDSDAFRQVVAGTMVGLFVLLLLLIWIFVRVGGLPKSL